MKLKWPNSDIDFDVHLRFFLGCFDIYDREETLGEYLNQFNPLGVPLYKAATSRVLR